MLRLLITGLVLCPLLLAGQNAVEPLIKLFEQKKYKETLREAKVKRNSARASELASIDLIIACSYCLDEPTPRRGKAVLDKITNNYRLNRKQERSVQQIRAVCGTPTAAVRLPELDVVKAVRDMGEVSVRGGSGKTRGITLDNRFRVIDLTSEATPTPPTHGRHFALSEKEEAVAYYTSLYAGTEAWWQLTEYFLICSLSPIRTDELEALGARMDALLRAYVQTYGFDRPDGLITLHIAPDDEKVNWLSQALYGFKLGSDNLGYSDINNRSILTKITEPARYQGTLQHELMHIVVNYNSTLPPWLSEGFPALFEATTQDGLRGIGNWRYDVLKHVLPYQTEESGYTSDYLSPQLFEMNWAAFDAENYSVPGELTIDRLQQAVNHAAARYFVFYLQEWGKLEAVVAAFANYHFGHPSFEEYATNTELIEAVTGVGMDVIWEDYIRWLNKFE